MGFGISRYTRRMSDPILDHARQVLAAEADAIRGLRVGPSFAAAVKLVLKCKGHVITTGVGKAGLVAAKISATLASTGTPSMYLHASDAGHGDVGRVTADDIVLAFSNSGETGELVQLIPILRRIGAGLISITATKGSTLGKAGNLVLELGKIEEACPLGLAPSASTAAMLALGDALALTLMKERGLKPADFAMFHPGGELGKKLMKVGDIMRRGGQTAVVRESTPISAALMAITKARAGAVVVTNGTGAVTGIYTDGDLRRGFSKSNLKRPIKEVMTRTPMTITPDRLASEAAKILRDKKIDELPVVDARGKPVGVLDIQDLLDVGLI